MSPFPNNMAEAIDWLSSYGTVPGGGVTRTLYSKPWKEAQQALKEWMEDLGLQTSYDPIGNLFGRLASEDSMAPTILVGSHIDTVLSGGKYDGAYGILAGILALKHLKKHHGHPKVNLEVVSLCEEEGSRFPIACWGSGMMTGIYCIQDINGLRDSEGICFEQAMIEAGIGIVEQPHKVRSDISAFVELHIEQGPSLEILQKSIGIVQSIVGQKRFRITVKGEPNHAGTTLMKWRKDSLLGAVTMIHDLHGLTKEYDEDLVTTVGQLFVEPNVPNVIPGQVEFTVDARHPVNSVLSIFCEQFKRRFLEIAQKLGLEIGMEMWHDVQPVQMDAQLQHMVQTICMSSNISYHVMNSGAGHDSQFFARMCPSALVFVPSQGGISHSPSEYTTNHDLETGLSVLIQLLHRLAYK
ncbi:Zn-dependent hydrolase [Neobacillus niacini]|uniref:Zn-dependent hydrolase n=1 Tax=Neobacillus niacini TaxID=86668 RepID=UPI00285C9711|nr:Zn-dependent hydrolase [Neobacillus niacini]MDR7001417.1 allantoate deiminase [Neobacillus niacini]